MSAPTFKERFHNIYRATYTQSIVIGVLSFTQPGIWSAISNLGGGGLQTVGTANTASAILYGIMFVLSPLYSVLINKIGIKPVVTIGTLGYVVWSAGLYQNSKDGTQWLIMFGAATCGVSAAAFWTAEATIAILYPTDKERGKFIGTWQVINKVGGLISGAITVALNHNTSTSGSVSLNTYIALFSIQCLGLPISFLLSSPEKLIRPDGRRLKSTITNDSWSDSFLKILKVLKRKEVLCLLPLFISNVWFGTWQSNYITNHFSVRVRALNSLLSALIGGATDVIAGYLLDIKMRKSIKVKVSWLITVLLMVAFFIYSFILQAQFDRTPESGIDWNGNPRYAKAFIPFQFFKISGELVFNWVYWVIGAYHFEYTEIAYISGLVRAFESFGQCMAFVVGTVNSNDMVNLAVSAAVFFASIPSVTYLSFLADDEDESIDKVNVDTEDRETVPSFKSKDKIQKDSVHEEVVSLDEVEE